MNKHERIELTDSPMSAIIKIAEGNPGAACACAEILKHGARVDPDSSLGGLGGIFALDTHGIYGSRVWMLYSDVCGKKVDRMLALLRWVQLGFGTEAALNHAIDNRGDGLDVDAAVSAVMGRLKGFTLLEPLASAEGEQVA